jgi:hypothetical protein
MLTSLLLYGIFIGVLVSAAAAFLIALASDARPIVLGVIATVAGVGLLGFLAAQLSPLGRRQQRLAVLTAQTEGARSAIAHNRRLWDAYLQSRGSKLKVDEIAIAVQSLSVSSQGILANLALDAPRGGPRTIAPPLPKDSLAVNPAVAAKY